MLSAELAPKHARGRLGSVQQLSITFGILISFCVNLIFDGVGNGWRYSLGLQSAVRFAVPSFSL